MSEKSVNVNVDTPNGGIDVQCRVWEFSPCMNGLGVEYTLVVLEGRHPMMSDAPIRVHATATSRADATSHARVAFGQVYNRATKQAGRRTQETHA